MNNQFTYYDYGNKSYESTFSYESCMYNFWYCMGLLVGCWVGSILEYHNGVVWALDQLSGLF